MRRLHKWWEDIRSSMWVIPAALTLSACILAAITIALDRKGVVRPENSPFILASGAEGARGVLSTIAGSIITVTGVVFSITIVVLQLASSQYSPRVLRSFTEDRINQVVLGVFIATFTYSLLVLRTVRSSFADYDRFVPSLSVNVAVVLALLSIALLIYFVNHIAKAIQAESIIAKVTADAIEVVYKLFPEDLGEDAAEDLEEADLSGVKAGTTIAAQRGGYLQAVDEKAIMELAESENLLLRLDQEIGAFVIPGDSLATVLSPVNTNTAERLRKMFQIGNQRTRHQDVERGLIELTDIAIRALSPGINDPTTALVCVDRLTQIYAALGCRRFPSLSRKGSDGKVRVVATRREFPSLLALGFEEIRHHARDNPTVLRRLESSLERLINKLPPWRHEAVVCELTTTRALLARGREGVRAAQKEG